MKKFIILLLLMALILCGCGAAKADILAEEYVNSTATSKAYLIYHLQCIGFSQEEAYGAAENCKADWSKEALEYYNIIKQSCPELTQEELLYVLTTQGFTKEEIDWVTNKTQRG